MKPLLLYQWVVAVDDDGDSYIRYVTPNGMSREFHSGWHYPEGTAKWAAMTCKFFNEWSRNSAKRSRLRKEALSTNTNRELPDSIVRAGRRYYYRPNGL